MFRLKGKGVKSAGRAEAGDQLVTVRIVLPDVVDDSLAYFFSEWRQKHRLRSRPQVGIRQSAIQGSRQSIARSHCLDCLTA